MSHLNIFNILAYDNAYAIKNYTIDLLQAFHTNLISFKR